MKNIEFTNKILEAMQYKIQELEIDKGEIKITFLEDGDIAVLENIRTGESLTMNIKELWNYAI